MTETQKLDRAAAILDLIVRARAKREMITNNIAMLDGCFPELKAKFVHQLDMNTRAFKRLKEAYRKQIKELKAI